MDTWLVTGAAGFIGRAVVARLLEAEAGPRVVALDTMTYAAHPDALRALGSVDRLEVVVGDVADSEVVDRVFAAYGPSVVLNLAAESHVDRSLVDAEPFVRTNVIGAWVVAGAARNAGIRLVQVSTDEVYGDREGLPESVEGDPVQPTNPYAATKAAADAIVASMVRSHGLDAVITRGVNTYGPGQFPEKLLPLAAKRWDAGEPMGVYGDGLQQREWLHVHDHAAGIIAAARRAEAGSVVHLGGGEPIPNRVVLAMWRDALGADTPEPWLVEAADRPGHDRAYRLHDAASRQRLGWAPQLDLPEGLAATAGWWRTEAATFWADR